LLQSIARKVRVGEFAQRAAANILAGFDIWVGRTAQRVELSGSDIAAAATWLRRLDLSLRTADALNIAIAHRVGASLATFDKKMAIASRKLGVRSVVT